MKHCTFVPASLIALCRVWHHRGPVWEGGEISKEEKEETERRKRRGRRRRKEGRGEEEGKEEG